MTVKDLREALKNYPEDEEVIVLVDTQDGIVPPQAFQFVGESLPLREITIYSEEKDADVKYLAVCVEDIEYDEDI